MSYLGLIDAKTAAKTTTAPATTQPAKTVLLNTKMTTYAQVKPTVQQNVVKPTVTTQPAPETTVMVVPNAVGVDRPSGGEVEITSTQPAPPAAEVQVTAQAATAKTNWLPWALGAAGLFWFYKKK